MRLASILGLLLAGAVTCVDAQWLNHRDPKIPRTADGKPDLFAPAPRLDGKPDLTGVWQAERTPLEEFVRVLGPVYPQLQIDFTDVTKHFANVFWGMKPDEEPLRPEAAALLKQRRSSGQEFTAAYCLPASLPATISLLAFKMVQAPGQIVVMPGSDDPPRQIYTDGRTLPADPDPTWTGHSVGSWQGETLVVETVGITTRAPLDAAGHPRSEAMRITERFRRRDVGHIDFEISFDDAKYYTRPFGFKTTLLLLPDTDVLEYVCTENQKRYLSR
jgi:predicted outer membrane lipoprotein